MLANAWLVSVTTICVQEVVSGLGSRGFRTAREQFSCRV